MCSQCNHKLKKTNGINSTANITLTRHGSKKKRFALYPRRRYLPSGQHTLQPYDGRFHSVSWAIQPCQFQQVHATSLSVASRFSPTKSRGGNVFTCMYIYIYIYIYMYIYIYIYLLERITTLYKTEWETCNVWPLKLIKSDFICGKPSIRF